MLGVITSAALLWLLNAINSSMDAHTDLGSCNAVSIYKRTPFSPNAADIVV